MADNPFEKGMALILWLATRKIEHDVKKRIVLRLHKDEWNSLFAYAKRHDERIAELERQLADARKAALEEALAVARGTRNVFRFNNAVDGANEVVKALEAITAPPEQGKCFNCNFANLRTWEPSKILLCESCRRNGGTEDHYQPITPPEPQSKEEMKILEYGNRKSDDVYYLIDTPEQEAAAYLAIFKELDGYWQRYVDASAPHKLLAEKARQGDAAAAKKLMKARKDYEYEYVHEEIVKDATQREDTAHDLPTA